jgi:hypothetical protein
VLNILKHTIRTYIANIYLVLLSSLAFIIAFLIPIFASFPTYNDLGGVLLRTASIYVNLNPFTTAIIIISILFSLLFLSFAIVAINLVVKARRTQTKVKLEVIKGLEKYTSNVFVVLLLATVIIILANILSFNTGYSGLITAIVALAITPFIFYAPASIVVDDNKVLRSIKASIKFFIKRPDYFVIWLVIAIVIITLFDFVFIVATGTIISRYAMLVFSSIFILPFLVLMQSELYINRFKLLKS